MEKYFAYDLPRSAPAYLDISMADKFEEVVETVAARMDKLEEALSISGLRGSIFSAAAKKIFDNFFERFEEMDSTELMSRICDLYDPYNVPVERIEWPNAVTVVDTAFVSTKEWEMLRHIGIGGSDAAVVLGTSPYRTARELYYDKTGTAPKKPEEDKTSIFKRGHVLEEDVIDAFCTVTGAKRIPETRMFRSKEYPMVTANPDAIVQFPDGRIFVYEAKTTVEENWPAWAGESIPRQYIPQTRQYPAVLDDDRIAGTYIGCLFTKDYTICGEYVGSGFDGRRFCCHVVDRDKLAEESIMKAEKDFYEEHLMAGVLPPASLVAPEREIKVIQAYSGPADPSLPVMDMDQGTFTPLAEQYLEVHTKLKDAESAVKALKVQLDITKIPLIEALGQYIEGRIPISDDACFW